MSCKKCTSFSPVYATWLLVVVAVLFLIVPSRNPSVSVLHSVTNTTHEVASITPFVTDTSITGKKRESLCKAPKTPKKCKGIIIAKPSVRGLGHNWMGLMMAIVAAHRFNTRLELSSNFWSPLKRLQRNASDVDMYQFADNFLSIPTYNDNSPSHITKLVSSKHMSNVMRCHKSVYAADFGNLFCGGGNGTSEHGTFCSLSYPGMYDEASVIIETNYRNSLVQAQNQHRSDPVLVYWHVRTGDVSLSFSAKHYLTLKSTIDTHFKHRTVVHKMFTQNTSQAILSISNDTNNENVMDEFVRSFNMIDDYDVKGVLTQLLSANVLVTMGSSVSYLIPVLRRHSDFVHFFFPPKEACWKNKGHCKNHGKDFRTAAELVRQHKSHATFFVAKGVVPVYAVGGLGEEVTFIFPEYHKKMQSMLSLVDQALDIPRNLSILSYENWTSTRNFDVPIFGDFNTNEFCHTTNDLFVKV